MKMTLKYKTKIKYTHKHSLKSEPYGFCPGCKKFFKRIQITQYYCSNEKCQKERARNRVKQYRNHKENKERIIKQTREWQRNNPEKFKINCKRYMNKPGSKEKFREYQKEWYKNNWDKHNESIRNWRQTEKGKKYENSRRNKNFIPIFPNIFPKEIFIDYHHIDGNMFVVPIPRKIHRSFNGGKSNLKKHIETCNNWIEFYYGMHPNEFLHDF